MNVPQKMEASALNTVSIYAQDGQNYTFKNYLRNISDIQISALQSNGMFR